MSSFGLRLNLPALLSGFEADKRAVREAARPAAQAGAQILYDAVKRNAAAIPGPSGKLAAAIYQAFSRDQSVGGLSVYHVSWNARKAPHGHLVEYGHLQRYQVVWSEKQQRYITLKNRPLATPKPVPARPFVRPAAALIPQALEASEQRFFLELAQRGVVR